MESEIKELTKTQKALMKFTSPKNMFLMTIICFVYLFINSLKNFIVYFQLNALFIVNNLVSILFSCFALFGFYSLYKREKILETPNITTFAEDKSFISAIEKNSND